MCARWAAMIDHLERKSTQVKALQCVGGSPPASRTFEAARRSRSQPIRQCPDGSSVIPPKPAQARDVLAAAGRDARRQPVGRRKYARATAAAAMARDELGMRGHARRQTGPRWT